MGESLEAIKKLINECSDEDHKALRTYLRALLPHPLEREWGIDADTILTAINRSSDLSKRGVRGIIAEAVFVNEVLPTVEKLGWQPLDFVGDRPFDALVRKGATQARIQVKLQRLEGGLPKLYYPKYYSESGLFVVEVQKTRTGERPARTTSTSTDPEKSRPASIYQTRPYSFADFDILAVNMHPSSGNWNEFRYTVASWLLPRTADATLIEIFQPVSATPNDVWADDLATCLNWLASGVKRQVLADVLHPRRFGVVGKRSTRSTKGAL